VKIGNKSFARVRSGEKIRYRFEDGEKCSFENEGKIKILIREALNSENVAKIINVEFSSGKGLGEVWASSKNSENIWKNFKLENQEILEN
jgi:hypothetical protein